MSAAEVIDITLRTIGVGLTATLINLPFGVALAYLLARRSFTGKSLVQSLVALPMVLPPVAVGLILLLALSETSPLGRAIAQGLGIEIVFNWKGAALASAVMAFPLLVRSMEQAFREVPRRLEQVGATLGLGPWAIFFRISLPLAKRGLAYGSLLSFARALGEFGATSLVAGNIPGSTETLALGIYSHVINGRDGAAVVLMFVSLTIAVGAMWAGEAFLRQPVKDEAR